MFRFFTTRKWFLWCWPGLIFIVWSTWYRVQMSVAINKWFGDFYNMLQKTLEHPGTTTLADFNGYLLSFGKIAAVWIALMVIVSFLISHWTFRWRTAITEYYIEKYHQVGNLENKAQRVQDDAFRFTRMVEGLGAGLLDSILTLIAFLPLLWNLSMKVIPPSFYGQHDYVPYLVTVALVMAIGGTVLVGWVGRKLPSNEYKIQAAEAYFRKELVRGEDDPKRAYPSILRLLYRTLTSAHYYNYWLYFKFNIAKYGFLQFMVLVPYIALGPSIVGGVMTLGLIQQITRAFGEVESSLQYILRSWGTLVELISVLRRLREYQRNIAEKA